MKVKKQNHNKEEKDVQTVKASKGKTSKKVKKHKAAKPYMTDKTYYDLRKQYKAVKSLEQGSETTNKILSIARKAGCTAKIRGRKIRVYTKNDVPVMKITGFTQKNPSVFIHIHATEDEAGQFFKKTKLDPKAWKQPQGKTSYQYVSKKDDLLIPRIKKALPEILKRAALG